MILWHGLCQIGKVHGNLHGIIFYACNSAPPLVGGFLLFAQVCLRLDEMCLVFSPGLFRLQFFLPISAVLLKLSCIRDDAVCYANDLSLRDGIARSSWVVYALVEPCIDALEQLVGVGLVPAQDVHFFYTRSHFIAFQNCALLFSTNFQIIFIFKNALHNLVIELCSAPSFLQKYCTVIY